MGEYVLGTNDDELARLAFQHEVWAGVTGALLDRAGDVTGGRVLDLGCGPGFVLEDLRARVGSAGHVVAVDESERWFEHLGARARDEGWTNVELRLGTVEEVELEDAAYDLIFSRWVFSFLPDTAAVLRRLARALRPGGALAIQDYNHEGVSLFPPSAGFEAMVRATRDLYESAGGDTWVAGRLPGEMRAAGLELFDFHPNVIGGGPDSPAFRWADSFFPRYSADYETRGLITSEERALFQREWEERKRDPDTTFFSPIVVDLLGRKA